LLVEASCAVTVPEFVKIAPCVLSLLIWMTGLLTEPSAEMVPELLIETTPLTLLATPLPVPAEIPTPLATVIVP
jgi:hypothetical protein